MGEIKISAGEIELKRGRSILVSQSGVFVGVQYPYRKTPDLYIAMKEHPVFCASCKATFPVAEFVSHVLSHDRRKGVIKRLTRYAESEPAKAAR